MEREEAAVLVPTFGKNDKPHVLLIKRAETSVHGGQIAFPGGRPEKRDRGLRETAIRETCEETGLTRERIKIIKELEPMDTISSNFTITPFLARVNPPTFWKPHHEEVADILEVPIEELLAEGARGTEMWTPEGGEPMEIGFFRWKDQKIWGATYRILTRLLGL